MVLEAIEGVAVRVLQPGAQAARVPIAWRSPVRTLEIAGHGGDDAVDVIGHPVSFMVVIELHIGGLTPRLKDDIGTVQNGIDAVIFVPTIVESRLVLEVAGGQIEYRLPDIIDAIVGQMGGSAFWLPVAGTAQLALAANRRW